MSGGHGGWHWLVLKNGIEVKLQRNALSVIEAPTGDEKDEDLEIEDSESNFSDLDFDDHHKSHRSRHHTLKPTGSAHKTVNQSFSCDSQLKSAVPISHGSTMVVEEVTMDYSNGGGGCEGEDETGILPGHTKVVITGNNRTKSVLVGLQGVVKTAAGRGWHWLVLSNGMEVKLHRSALSVIAAPTGDEKDEDLELENSQQNIGWEEIEDETGILPRHTKVVITGNNRTKSVLVGLQGVVKRAAGRGWHWLVLSNGLEVKLQRSALSVIATPTGDEKNVDLELENSQLNISDLAFDDESHKSRHHTVKPTVSAHKTISRSLSRDSQLKSVVTIPHESMMVAEEITMDDSDGGGGCEEELGVLPPHTKVVVTGNNRTKSLFVGLQGVVKTSGGIGGWHWLVLSNGMEIKLQRNALSVIEAPTGDENDEDLEIENSQWDVSDLAFDDGCKSHRLRHRALKPTESSHKTISRTLSCDTQLKDSITTSHGSMVMEDITMEDNDDGCEENDLTELPPNTRVVITGNNRTKSVLIGQEGVVKMAVGQGGWHWLVLKNGKEVNLQRNALTVIKAPSGNDNDKDLEIENSQRNVSDLASDDGRKSDRSRHCALKPTGSAHKTISRSVSCDLRLKRSVTTRTRNGSMKVDLGKLEMTALKRYWRHFNLMDGSPNPSREQLLDVVQKHFMSEKLDELQVIAGFVQAAKKLKAMYK
ncbi:hypothetical protein CTI12_AA237790 [Artemisia annua]|uniref:Histone deacetylase complex subunit SAP30 Sin3 binding domain-containing protein n=1 Tax=Artemisia annua TaxID=35608 RepID=A0A2U1MN90_ARTAN|nr:hypothetical protein CTI12_AA237790 [Artemisia annua]